MICYNRYESPMSAQRLAKSVYYALTHLTQGKLKKDRNPWLEGPDPCSSQTPRVRLISFNLD